MADDQNVVKLSQIKEAKSLYEAYLKTSKGSTNMTFSEMVKTVVEMDRETEIEDADYHERLKLQNSR